MNKTFNFNLKGGVKAVRQGAFGLSTAGLIALHTLILPWEGRVYTAYIDTIGGNEIPTVCGGVTGEGVIVGKTYTDPECDHLEAKALRKHENGLRAALVNDEDIPDLTLASWISWTYNVGPGAAGRSTLVRLANAGDLVGACNQLSRWTRVNGQVIRGLENRRFRGDAQRLSERTVCLIGLGEVEKTPLFEKWWFSYRSWVNGLVA